MKKLLCISALLLAGCGSFPTVNIGPGKVERMYVIECGENHVKDLSRWTPGVNVGKAHVFSDHCYLIRHAKGWMLWDSGNADRLAALPNGLTAPNGIITAYMRKPLLESLKEIGVEPKDIRYFAMSHSHGDHSGNANYFGSSLLLMQTSEYAAVFGPEPQKFNFVAANFEKLRNTQVEKLNGDSDVFGDGSVIIKATPGHTPGHQSLLVRLPKTGALVLSGDAVHFKSNWDNRGVPANNADKDKTLASMQRIADVLAKEKAQLWINHDKAQRDSLTMAPGFYE